MPAPKFTANAIFSRLSILTHKAKFTISVRYQALFGVANKIIKLANDQSLSFCFNLSYLYI
jgi:hypothetical protein